LGGWGPPPGPAHHRTATVHVRCTISFHIGRSRPLLLGTGWHTGQSGASNRPLELAMCRTLIARTTVGHWHSWLTGQSGAPPNNPVNFSHVAFSVSRERLVRRGWLSGQSGAPSDSPVNYSRTTPSIPESSWFTVGQHGAPDTVRCARPSWSLAAHSQVFSIAFLILLALFLALRQTHYCTK
jgi:hypothetical protein